MDKSIGDPNSYLQINLGQSILFVYFILFAVGFVNGANFSEFVDDIVLQNEPQTITGNLSFLKTLNLNSSLDVEGTINGLSLTEFNSSVHKVTDEEFTGKRETLCMIISLRNVLIFPHLWIEKLMNIHHMFTAV